MFRIIALFSYFFHLCASDWVSEWMSPIQDEFKENPSRRSNNDFALPMIEDDTLRMVQVMESTERNLDQMVMNYSPANPSKDFSTASLKSKLENTLQNAKMLAAALKEQIREVSAKENLLKEAIVNGRSGVSSVLVSPLDRPARAYIIRDGVWSLCRGRILAPEPSPYGYSEPIAAPRCLGQEILSQQDPCAFNSLVKYETVPTTRRLEYTEDDILCLKQSFNNTLERYMSVPRQIVNETCQNGIVRTLEENIVKCGIRVMSEYTYYPYQGYGSDLPLEYCVESDRSCKLIMAWHLTNSTVENFEFLKNEPGFQKYFIKSGYLEHVI